MFPIRDESPTATRPVVVPILIALNAAAWVLLQGLGSDPALASSVCSFGLIPGELLGTVPAGARVALGPEIACVVDGDSWFTPISSMFMHGGWFHLIGNMWFLWVFGDNVEDVTGHGGFLLFYLLCGLAAAAAQTISSPSSAVPMVGASGAIGGVMGAYAVKFPRHRIDVLFFFGFFVRVIPLPAIAMLGYWFALQLLSGTVGPAEGGGVAFWAHVGGFVAGAALVMPFARGHRRAAPFPV
jgi:membrane associated rhomboid family serine protease